MQPLKRIRTDVPGLDDLLGGGLLEAGVHFVEGGPGTGKTTFANQLCFAHIRNGGRALYLTLLSESHVRMMQHMVGQSFFDAAEVGNGIAYVSGYREFEAGSFKAIVSMVRTELARQRATMLVLDGLVMPAGSSADDDLKLKEFVHETQSLAAMLSCNVLLLTSGRGRSATAEQTMVDGCFSLYDEAFGTRNERLFQVSKFRGAGPLRGKHSFCITDDGLRIYPRLETLLDEVAQTGVERNFASTGWPALDACLEYHGIQRGSVSLLQGPAGSGKTTIALQFLAACEKGEKALLFSFNERPQLLMDLASTAGIRLEPMHRAGDLRVEWVGTQNHTLDQLGHGLLEAVAAQGARRVVIDSLGGFASTVMFEERGYRFLRALVERLRRLDATTVLIGDPDELRAHGVGDLVGGLGALVDNLVVSRPDLSVEIQKASGQRIHRGSLQLERGAHGLSLVPRNA